MYNTKRQKQEKSEGYYLTVKLRDLGGYFGYNRQVVKRLKLRNIRVTEDMVRNAIHSDTGLRKREIIEELKMFVAEKESEILQTA